MLAHSWVARPAIAASYDEMRTAAVARCEAIDPSAAQSGLAFNPDGYRSYYVRSDCFQSRAVEFRDERLCEQVKERRSLLWSSWGYSSSRCRELVAQGIAADRAALEEIKRQYREGAMTIRDFRVARNGNGRDFDILPTFEGRYQHGYVVTFEILPERNGAPALLYSTGHYVDTRAATQFYVPQMELRRRFPSLTLGQRYMVRATITLDVGNGGPSGHWSDRFVEQVFPIGERSRSLTKEISF